MNTFDTLVIAETQTIKGVLFPAPVKFKQLLLTGPPGSGKSTMARKLGGWSEEGYIDLGLNKWWTAQSLSIRPREIHLGMPFKGHEKSLVVFDREWLDASPRLEIDFDRICIPPMKRHFLSVDWLGRYVFEVLLPPADKLLERRLKRKKKGTHLVDKDLTLSLIQDQILVYEQLALYLQRQGITLYIREDIEGPPLQIIDPGQ